LSSGDPNSDFVPPWPSKLKPPAAPTVETTSQKMLQSALAQEEMRDESQSGEDDSDNGGPVQSVVAIPRAMTLSQIATAYLSEPTRAAIDEIRALNPQIRSENSLIPKGTEIAIPADSTRKTGFNESAKTPDASRYATERVSPQPEPNHYEGPVTVQVLRRETLFQFALEHYGSASWTIVEDICRANPSLRGAYDLLSPGQRVRLPEESPETSSSTSSTQSSRR
jgi:phage tail protein X